jgi:uncharacterized OsmC-like protein
MALMKIEYLGGKRCELTHLASNSKIITDAPIDNQGKGESFSPTDLLSVSLGACMMTIMGIQLEPLGISLDKSTCSVKKHMQANPRRISQIDIELKMCEGIAEQYRPQIAKIAETCPVQFSIHPDIQVKVQINYPD